MSCVTSFYVHWMLRYSTKRAFFNFLVIPNLDFGISVSVIYKTDTENRNTETDRLKTETSVSVRGWPEKTSFNFWDFRLPPPSYHRTKKEIVQLDHVLYKMRVKFIKS